MPRFERQHIDWNAAAILEKAGGSSSAIKGLLADQGFPQPNELAIYQWKRRGAIPHRWVPTLVYAILRAKRARFSDLLVRKSPIAPPVDDA